LHEDVLKMDWRVPAQGAEGGLYVIGNLPYYITTPILFALLEAAPLVRRAVLMMQLEVAQRLVAEPRTKAYGALSVMCQLQARVQLLFRVAPTVFFPRPDVTSAVVALETAAADLQIDVPLDGVRTVVRAAFNQRRKTLRNSLATIAMDRGKTVPERWAHRRAEELDRAEFVELARYLLS
jgi:16S rRNA (adenine1518-N6/adenine1519-N6)-dimethyltransferase